MSRQLQSDKVLFGAVVGLVLFGALMVFSASAVMAADRYDTGNYFLLRQLAWAVAGLIAVADPDAYGLPAPGKPHGGFPGAGAGVHPSRRRPVHGPPINNAHRWFHLGVASFQPSELAKIILTVFLAYFLDLRKGEVNDWRHTLLPIALVTGIMAVLVLRSPIWEPLWPW